MNIIRVSAKSRPSAVAGAIAGMVREHQRAEVQSIGAAAVNQAIKALILATGYLKMDGIQVHFVPEFAEVTIENNSRTAIKLVVEPLHLYIPPTESPQLALQVLHEQVNVDSSLIR